MVEVQVQIKSMFGPLKLDLNRGLQASCSANRLSARHPRTLQPRPRALSPTVTDHLSTRDLLGSLKVQEQPSCTALSTTSIYMYITRGARKRRLEVALPVPIRHTKSRRHCQRALCSLHERFHLSRHRRGRPSRRSASVVSHVRPDQMSCRQSAT